MLLCIHVFICPLVHSSFHPMFIECLFFAKLLLEAVSTIFLDKQLLRAKYTALLLGGRCACEIQTSCQHALLEYLFCGRCYSR